MIQPRAVMILSVALAAMLPSVASADGSAAPAAQVDAAALAVPARIAPSAAGATPFAGQAVTEDTLRSAAGREDTTQISHADQVAGVSRNSVGDNSMTGDAKIDGNAFQNMSGLSILNVNTGNNVAINAAMNVNISLGNTP
jgi:hypothetical protein